jgi:hypothetical protein
MVAGVWGGQIYTSSTWTTLGVTGGLSGGANDSVVLRYLGNGEFEVQSHQGTVQVR